MISRRTKDEQALFSSGRRDSTEIVYDILTLAQSGVSRSQIIQQGRLNFALANRYLSQLATSGLIQRATWGESLDRYVLTGRGERVLKLLSELESELIAQVPSSLVAGKFHPTPDSTIGENSLSSLVPILVHIAGFLAGVGLGYILP